MDSRIEMLIENGVVRDLRINGHTVHFMNATLRAGLDQPCPVLELELPVIDAEIKGSVAVAVTNAGPGSRMVLDTQGRAWIEPAEEGAQVAGDSSTPPRDA
jgi:hypothetical protein